jgi:hypothetical protein
MLTIAGCLRMIVTVILANTAQQCECDVKRRNNHDGRQ